MPNRLVLWSFPALVAVVFALLVATGVNGSSSGMLYQEIHGEADPRLITGHPQSIRSDEWNVFSIYVVAQDELGFPQHNPAGMGGVDTTAKPDVPVRHWSVLLRPQHWGFFFLPFENAIALRWWFGSSAMAVACYFFVVLLLPRYPVVGAATATGFFFSPFVQWWYLVEVTAPLAWGLWAMAAFVWLGRARRWWGRLALAGVTGYATCWAALALYPPFTIPCAWVVAGYVIGQTLTRQGGGRWRTRLRPAAWLLGGGLAGAGAAALFAWTRWATFAAALSTSYPGQRLIPPGEAWSMKWRVLPLTGLFSRELLQGPEALAGNDSESSAFILVTLFLAPVAVWCIWRRWRRQRVVDGAVIGALAGVGLILAYSYVPGWGPLAHLLLLDRSSFVRMQIGLGLGSVVLLVVVVRSLLASGVRRAPWPAVVTGVFAYFMAETWALSYAGSHGLAVPLRSVGMVCLVLGAVVLVAYGRGRNSLAAVAALAISLGVGWGVNPLSRGLFDLRETDSGRAVKAWARDHPGGWVAMGNITFTPDIAVAAGVDTRSGFQFAPNREAWSEIDPTGAFEPNWNRLGNIRWIQDPSLDRISSPIGDVILVAFDPCADYEQTHIANVFTSAPLAESECLVEAQTWPEGQHQFYIYTVTPPAN
jgi:hypothetical protein